VDQAVQENRLCLQSLKYGYFKDFCVERLSFVSGEGKSIQTGGYKVKDSRSFGLDMTDLIASSHYSLGLLFEVVLNCFKYKAGSKGKLFELKIPDGTLLP